MGVGFRLAASALLVAAATSAEARDALEMRLGRSMPPPPGYEAFCRREPRDCPAAPKTGPAFWSDAFGSRRSEDAMTDPPASIRRARHRPWVFERAPVAPSGRAKLTEEVRATIERVNRDVNRAMASTPDWKLYGRADYWALPLSRPGRKAGDCEDYVMEKRHQLLAAGFTMAQLSIALVRTRWGETHAVLLVETDAGALVLDNRRDAVRPWWRVKDRWIMRQSPESPGAWVAIPAASAKDRRAG
jgi:predicted transglutaminase-like cysteine proteinase